MTAFPMNGHSSAALAPDVTWDAVRITSGSGFSLRIGSGAPAYVGTARRDPDGKGFRLALARKVTINSMTAGD